MPLYIYLCVGSNNFLIVGGEPVTCKGEFTASGVHKQFGISFKTPKYPNQNIKEDVRVRCYVHSKLNVFFAMDSHH